MTKGLTKTKIKEISKILKKYISSFEFHKQKILY